MSDPIYPAPAPRLFKGCGWEWDHSLNLIAERDGYRTYECRTCGAEILEGDDE